MDFKLDWDPLKSESLKRTRGLSFEELIRCTFIKEDRHPTRIHQRVLLFERLGYIWAVPFVAKGDRLFLKTAYPTRKMTKKYRRGEI